MSHLEYKVVPAPTKAKRGRWMRSSAGRFADRLQQVFNDQAKDGWEYVRTDTLPCEERQGLSQKTISYQNLLIFKRLPEVQLALPDQTEKQNLIPSPQHFTDMQEAAELFPTPITSGIPKAPAPLMDLDLARPQVDVDNHAAAESAIKDDNKVVSPAAWFTNDVGANDPEAEIVEELSPALLSRLKQVRSSPGAA